jgi:hypothetical protein
MIDIKEELAPPLPDSGPLLAVLPIVSVVCAVVSDFHDDVVRDGIDRFDVQVIMGFSWVGKVEPIDLVPTVSKDCHMRPIHRIPIARDRDLPVPRIADSVLQYA